jgi:beta-galactosidase
VEQLLLTGDRSDYCWYATEVTNQKAGTADLEIPFCGDFLRIYLDGALVGHSPLPLAECRGCTLPGQDAGAVIVQGVAAPPEGAVSKYSLKLTLPVKPGRQTLEILACSLGLVKGDWMVAGSMESERKGIWDRVLWNGKELMSWKMYPGLVGEADDLCTYPHRVNWLVQGGVTTPAWHRCRFELPKKFCDSDLRLDAAGLGKGILFVNGHPLGRHWLIPGHGFGNDSFWVEAERHGLTLGPDGEPTQRYYKIPASWLCGTNELVLFEEEQPDFSRVRLEARSWGLSRGRQDLRNPKPVTGLKKL